MCKLKNINYKQLKQRKETYYERDVKKGDFQGIASR